MPKSQPPMSQPAAGGRPQPNPAPVPPSQTQSMSFDPRTLGTPVYEKLKKLKEKTLEKEKTKDSGKLKKQKSMTQELYTYLSTWGLMRLKAEETILKDGREDPVKTFFACLAELSGHESLDGDRVLDGLEALRNLSADEYLGLTGLGLEIAREFSFWVSAIYHDVQGED